MSDSGETLRRRPEPWGSDKAHLPTLSRTLAEHERRLRGRPDGRGAPRDGTIARDAGCSPASYHAFKASGPDRRLPSVVHLAGLCDALGVPFGATFDRESDPRVYTRDGVRWRLSGEVGDSQTQCQRLAAHLYFAGLPADEIWAWLARVRAADGRGLPTPTDKKEEIHWMVRGALSFGLVTLSHAYDTRPDFAYPVNGDVDISVEPRQTQLLADLQDDELATRLTAALAAEAPEGDGPTVYVAKNVGHGGFELDPAAPFTVARIGHHVMRTFLATHPRAHFIGLGGGAHVETFVRSMGAGSSPLPDTLGGAHRYQLHPLTHEVHPDHELGLAADLVGAFQQRVGNLVNPGQVSAPTGRDFEATENPKRPSLPNTGALHVGVYGCGDGEDRGWMTLLLKLAQVLPEPMPVTDVALNLLDAQGRPVEVKDKTGLLLQLGVDLLEIKRVASSPRTLGLLLTSGPKKGLPIVAVARAGAASVIVCDQWAAKAALGALG